MLNLKSILKGKVVIVCVGNRDRGDDGVGPYLYDEIKEKTPHEVIDAGVTPENYTGVITKLKPDTIIIVDTVQFEGASGEAKIFSGDDLRTGKISTHDVSLKLLIDFLKSSTNASIHILGIKPKSNKLGEGLSDAVKKTVYELTLVIGELTGVEYVIPVKTGI